MLNLPCSFLGSERYKDLERIKISKPIIFTPGRKVYLRRNVLSIQAYKN